MTPNPSERRKYVRYVPGMPFSVQVILPEDTALPEWLMGKASNFAADGMQLYLEDVPADLYPKLLERIRRIRVIFTNPSSGKEIDLTGTLVYIDFHKSKSMDRSGCGYMGVLFDERKNPGFGEYERFIGDFESGAYRQKE